MAEADTEGLRRRIAELEAENARLRRAGQVEIELAASREALHASEARYRLVVESATDFAIFTMDLRRRVTSWNTGAERVLGWSEQEALGQVADMIFTPEDLAAGAPEQEARSAVEQGRAEDVRWHVRRDGSRLWANGLMLPLRDEAGAIQGLLKIFRDQTGPKRAEEELRAGEARLRLEREFLDTLIRQAPVGISIAEAPSGRVLFLNDVARKLIGHGELGGDAGRYRLYGAEHSDGRPYAVEDYPTVRSLRHGEVIQAEEMIYRRGGVAGRGSAPTRRLEVSSAPVRDEAGGIVAAVTVLQDVEEQRRAAELLQQSNERLEQQVAERTAERNRLWESSPDLLLVIDFDGVFRRVNPAWTILLGYESDTLVGHHVNEFVISDDAPKTTDAYELAARGGLPKIENRYRHKDGSTRWISWAAAPVGDLTYAIGRDVTGERAAADELAKTQEALRQSQKMEAVGQLTGGLAHDFNNLLVGVMGSLELLQTRIAQGRIKDVDRYVNAAQGAAKRAAALTHRLLAFSRRQTLDPKPTDVNRRVGGMEELIRRTVGPEIMVEPMVGAAGLWPTLVDPGQLENALLNLCINARDAMPDGGKLTIETGNRWLDERTARDRDLPPGQYVSLCVSDTGTGMPPEVIAKAFDPFFTTKPIGQGTGLGLSMIYGFAKQSGGQVRIYSEVGQGTMACIYLPRHLGEAETVELAPELADAPRAEDGQTVLVVDDEPTVRMLVTEVLEDLGYRAIEAADGGAGLQVLQSDARIDLLVTDVGLPGGMNGRQVADAARRARPDLKVLFITGYAENAVLSHGHLDPGMHVLTKPFAMEALASRIKELISD